MSQFFLEPTPENLERLKKIDGNTVYWLTVDFFLFDSELDDSFFSILDHYMDITEDTKDSEQETERKRQFSLGRMIVKAAREAGIPPRDYNIQYSNYATVIWTPICIWEKGESGVMHYSLMNNIPKKRT